MHTSSYKNLIQNFTSPPKEYGEVAFYWRIGEKLTKERLLWQLVQLKNRHFCGLQINDCHSGKGGFLYGLPYQSDLPLFSEDRRELFGRFLEEAEKRGMTLSLSDHTLGAAGQRSITFYL